MNETKQSPDGTAGGDSLPLLVGRYATACGIYDHEAFEGPPPMPYDLVYDAKAVEVLLDTLREYLSYNSSDGRIERMPLREKLRALLSSNAR